MNARAIATAFVVGIVTGCATPEYHFEMDSAGAIYTDLVPDSVAVPDPSRSPIALPIELVVDEALRGATWRQAVGTSRLRLPLGALLADRIEDVACNVFSDVSVVSERSAHDRPVLRPRFVEIERTLPHLGAGGGPARPQWLTIALEWRLEEPAGRLVWAETVTVTTEMERGEQPQRAMIRRAVESLLAESQSLLERAPEILARAARG